MEFALKHIFSRDILPYIKSITQLMHELDDHGGRDFIAIVLQQYILGATRGHYTNCCDRQPSARNLLFRTCDWSNLMV